MKTEVRIVGIVVVCLLAISGVAHSQGASPSSTSQKESRLGDAALAQGDYPGALTHYSAAGDSAGLDRLARELLTRRDYDGFLQCRQQAGKRVAVLDGFPDNSRGWNIRNDTYVNASISGGKLVAEKVRDDGISYLWVEAGLDSDKDFLVEATITKISGQDDNGFSVAWGTKDSNDSYLFSYSGDGHYSYSKWSGGNAYTRIPWTESAAINKGNAANVISVRKNSDTMSFSINGQVLATRNFEEFSGSKVGIAISPKARVEVSSFKAEEYSSARGAWSEIALEATRNSDFPVALKYYFAAGAYDDLRAAFVKCVSSGGREIARQALKEEGLSDKAVKVRSASFLYSAGMRAEAVTELRRAGWDLSSSLSYPLADEKFADNSREWSTASDERSVSTVGNGMLTVESKKGLSTWNFFDLSPDADYRIDARIRFLSDAGADTFALIWGFQKTSDCEQFGIDGSGNFYCGYTKRGKWISVIPRTPSPAIARGNTENTLTIVRTADTTTFLVNGTPVGHTTAREPTGKCIGFSIGKLSVEIAELRVVEYAPEFSIDLARSDLFASNPNGFAKMAAQMHLDEVLYDKALEEYGSLGTAGQEGAAVCNLRMGDAAADGTQWDKALELYVKAGASPEAMQGQIKAYQALGRDADAEPVLARLGEWHRGNGRPGDAMKCFLQLTKPALLNSAAAAYEKAGDLQSAFDLYQRAGNKTKAANIDKKLSHGSSRTAGTPAAAGASSAAAGIPAAKPATPVTPAVVANPAAANASGTGAVCPDVVLCAQSTGTGVTMFQVFDPNASGLLTSGKLDVVTLDGPGEEMNPGYFFDSGSFGIVLPEEGPNGHEATMFGAYAYKIDDNNFRVPVFTRKGAGEKGFGTDGSSIWLFNADAKELIAKVARQEVIGLDGEKKTLQMVRLVKGNDRKWITDSGNSIVELQLNGTLKQIGWVTWRDVIIPEGKHMALLMTRSMAPGSKWTARYDGKIYREK